MEPFWQALAAIGTISAVVVALLIAVFKENYLRWKYRPELTATIRPWGPPHSHLTAHYWKHPDGRLLKGAVYYLRLWVGNIGNVRADQVQVFAANLYKKDAGCQFHEVKSFLPMSLRWSHSGTLGPRIFTNLNPKMPTHCDIGFIEDPEFRKTLAQFNSLHTPPDVRKDKTLISLELEVRPAAFSHILEPGEYKLELRVGAANAEPITKVLEITLTGRWFDNEYNMFKDGVVVKEIS